MSPSPLSYPTLSDADFRALLASQRRTRIYGLAAQCVWALVVAGLVVLGLWA